MSFIDKAKEMLEQHDDKVDQALEKAGDFAKTKLTGHDEQIDSAVDELQKRTGGGDTQQG